MVESIFTKNKKWWKIIITKPGRRHSVIGMFAADYCLSKHLFKNNIYYIWKILDIEKGDFSMIKTFNTENFTDLKDLAVDKTKAKQERLKQFIADVKNPYMVRVGDTLVKIEFTGGRNFSDALTAAFAG